MKVTEKDENKKSEATAKDGKDVKEAATKETKDPDTLTLEGPLPFSPQFNNLDWN